MSFAFDFAADELDDTLEGFDSTDARSSNEPVTAKSEKARGKARCMEVSLDELFEHMPPRISFSTVAAPLRLDSRHDGNAASGESSRHALLRRRDLFDARFQLLTAHLEAEDDADADAGASSDEASQGVDASTDLVPGIYEGGLKTWECSLDLVSVLHDRFGHSAAGRAQLGGLSILEIGCGTALPSAYLLGLLFSTERDSKSATELMLLDYNLQVLQLVTLPNLLLAWYFSAAAEKVRMQHPVVPLKPKKGAENEQTAQSEDGAELPVKPELVDAFRSALASRGIALRFFAGDWAGFEAARAGGSSGSSTAPAPLDLILTSETIYSLDSLPSLVELLCACTRPAGPASVQRVSQQLAQASLEGTQPGSARTAESADDADERALGTLCLVAAKVLYFGVGGGVQAFMQVVKAHRRAGTAGAGGTGWVETVDRVQQGVGRVVLSVGWE